eukprot:m.234675 g.234675  ORF g.234675 m.234675 type:complete len:532 (+) comp22476_c2_seq1:2055-3650(+)
MLLQAGARPQTRSARTGSLAIHLAAAADEAEVVQLLLDVNPTVAMQPNQMGFVALQVAAYHGSDAAVGKLLAADAEREQRACQSHPDGVTALHLACLCGHASTVALLLDEAAAAAETQTEQGLASGAPSGLGLADAAGRSALHWAAFHGSGDCVRALLARGAARREQDQHGQTPLQVAERCSNAEAAELLAEPAELDVTWTEDDVEQAADEAEGERAKDDLELEVEEPAEEQAEEQAEEPAEASPTPADSVLYADIDHQPGSDGAYEQLPGDSNYETIQTVRGQRPEESNYASLSFVQAERATPPLGDSAEPGGDADGSLYVTAARVRDIKRNSVRQSTSAANAEPPDDAVSANDTAPQLPVRAEPAIPEDLQPEREGAESPLPTLQQLTGEELSVLSAHPDFSGYFAPEHSQDHSRMSEAELRAAIGRVKIPEYKLQEWAKAHRTNVGRLHVPSLFVHDSLLPEDSQYRKTLGDATAQASSSTDTDVSSMTPAERAVHEEKERRRVARERVLRMAAQIESNHRLEPEVEI